MQYTFPFRKLHVHSLRSSDIVSIVFLLFLSALHILYYNRIAEWWIFLGINAAVIFCIVVLAKKSGDEGTAPFIRFARDWYPVPLIVGVFKQIYFMVYPIRQRDYDQVLIEIDQWLFGVNPTEWMAQFSHPALTETLQIVYSTFYFLFLLVGYELYRRGMKREFYYAILLIVTGFYLSYIGYFLVPAIGPRFTIHDYHSINQDLPGLFLTDTIRRLLDAGESIPYGVPNPEDYVQRDVFPSGHTQLMMVMMYITVLYRMKCRKVIWIMGSLLIFSTVYLWYHYVIDVIAGGVFFVMTIYAARWIDRWWEYYRTDSS